MTPPKPSRSPGVRDAHEPHSRGEKLKEDASLASVTAGEALSAVEVGFVVFVGLLVCPPLAILAFVVVAPLLVIALVVGLLAAVLSAPYLLVHHFRGHHGGHATLLAHRLRHAGRALLDLMPHRIVSNARTGDRRR